jgi:hypothetical protein
MQIKAKRSCRSCPFRAPTGRCLDSTRKSGRCGIWVWYFRGNKQCRRRYARPKDPATLAQLLSRGRFGASSRRYGRSLTDKEQAACIAAGAKLRSRSRLNQSGPLTGQQYWVKKDSIHAKLNVKPTKAKTTPQLPQPQRVTRSTSGTHRSIAGVPPEPRRLGIGLARRSGGVRKCAERRMGQAAPPSQVQQHQKVTHSTRRHFRRIIAARPRQVAAPSRRAIAPPRHVWRTPRVTRNTGARRLRQSKAPGAVEALR